jgi:hypothetical protein
MMLPNLSGLRTADVAMPKRRTLPNFTTPPTKRQERDGWAGPTENRLSELDIQIFRAAMANLDSFDGSIQIDWQMSSEGGEFEDVQWGEATDVHKRAFGQVLRLWHQNTPRTIHGSSQFEATDYTPDEWFEVFDDRHGWSFMTKRRESSSQSQHREECPHSWQCMRGKGDCRGLSGSGARSAQL